MAELRPTGVPPAAVPSRTSPSRTGLFLFLGLLLLGGILWWALASNDRDDDVAVYQTTIPGQPGVTRTETDVTTTNSDAVRSARAPMVVETPAAVTTETDLSVTTTATPSMPDTAGDTTTAPAATADTTTGVADTGAERTDTTDPTATETSGITTGTAGSTSGTATTGSTTGTATTAPSVGATGGTTAGGEVSLSALELDPERYVGQTVTTTVTVRQLETLRGFWAESGTDRVFAVMPSASNDMVDQELLEGQQVRVTATVVDADDAAEMPELADMVDDDGRFLTGEEAVLRVSRIEILGESATR